MLVERSVVLEFGYFWVGGVLLSDVDPGVVGSLGDTDCEEPKVLFDRLLFREGARSWFFEVQSTF